MAQANLSLNYKIKSFLGQNDTLSYKIAHFLYMKIEALYLIKKFLPSIERISGLDGWEQLDPNNPFLWDEGNGYYTNSDIDDDQTSGIKRVVNLANDTEFVFEAKVSSEEDFDFLTISIDNNEVIYISGEKDWQRYSFLLSAGEHTIIMKYEKDGSESEGNDAGYVRNISFISGVSGLKILTKIESFKNSSLISTNMIKSFVTDPKRHEFVIKKFTTQKIDYFYRIGVNFSLRGRRLVIRSFDD